MGFLANWSAPFAVILFAWQCGRGNGRSRTERPFQGAARSDVGHEPCAREACARNRLGFLEKSFGAVYYDGPGQPPLPTRLMSRLSILKHMHDLSDNVLCERWVENPYYQLFGGEEFFQHKLPFDRSSLARWREHMGEERLAGLLQELFGGDRTGAAKPSDFSYAHAKQFNRAKRALKKTYLGRVMRDIARKIAGDEGLKEVFAHTLMLIGRVRVSRTCVLSGARGRRRFARLQPARARGRMHWKGQDA